METAVADELQETQQNIACPQLKLPICKANAAEYGKLGARARVSKALAQKQALRIAQERLEQVQPLIQASIAQTAAMTVEPEDQYRLERLQRTRQQLKRLDEQLEKERDPKCVKSLADAIGRLSDLEFALSGRSKPGLTRPRAPAKLKPGTLGPVEE